MQEPSGISSQQPSRSSSSQRIGAPFVPVNASASREDISERHHGFVLMRTPYDAALMDERRRKAESTRKMLAGPFVPSSAAKAKEAIRANYYMYSPDEDTISAEREFVQEQVRSNITQLKEEMRSTLLQRRALVKRLEEKETREVLRQMRTGDEED